MAITELHGSSRGQLTRVNDALCRLLGRPRAALRRQSFLDLVHPEDRGLLERTSAESGRAELRLSRRDGGYRWVCLRNSIVADSAEGPSFLLTHVEDIEDRKRHELQLAHRASHDALTGLPNGAELRARLARRLCSLPQGPGARPSTGRWTRCRARWRGGGRTRSADLLRAAQPPLGARGAGAGRRAAGRRLGRRDARHPGARLLGPGGARWLRRRAGRPRARGGPGRGAEPVRVLAAAPLPAVHRGGGQGLAVLFCDLDGFKSVNDRFGHNAGDAVLVEVARRLQQAVREGDTVARLGGDEFVVLADGIGSEEAADLAVRLRNAVVPPMRIAGRVVRVGVSMGIGWAGCGMSIEEVLHAADKRMYDEKRARGGAVRGARGERSHRRAV